VSARTAVEAVFGELRNRKGFGWWWDDLDEDIQAEIVDALREVIAREMSDE
jgi:hypothetical protein